MGLTEGIREEMFGMDAEGMDGYATLRVDQIIALCDALDEVTAYVDDAYRTGNEQRARAIKADESAEYFRDQAYNEMLGKVKAQEGMKVFFDRMMLAEVALAEARTRVLSVRDYEMCPNSFDRDCCCKTIWRLLGLGNGEDVLLWP